MRLAPATLLLALAACRSVGALPGSAARPAHQVEFAGASAFPAAELEAAIALDLEDLDKRTTPKSAADDAAWSLVELYRSRGFPDCAVRYELLDASKQRLRARFTIVEGPRARLEALEFAGNERLGREELLGVAGFAVLPRPWVESELGEVVDALTAHYLSKGYLEVQVERPEIELDASHEHARARIRVREGPCYRLDRPPRVEGGLKAIDAGVDTADRVGRPLSPRAVLDLRGRFQEAYEQAGHPDVAVEADPPRLTPEGRGELVLHVVPGPRVVVSELRVSGNTKTDESFVLAHVKLAAGEVYDVRKVRESFRELYRTGLFTRVQVGVEPGDAERRALQIELEEQPATELYLEPGLGSYEGPRLAAGWREHNLFGHGRSLQLEGLLAQRAQRVVAGVGDPRLFESETAASFSVFDEARQEPSFDKDERGAALTFSRQPSDELRLAAEYRFRRSELSNVDVNDPLPQDELSNVDISSIGLSGAWDTRDSVFIPGRGTQLKAGVELATSALGSELEFVRVKGTAARFIELREGRVLGLSWRAGVIAPIQSTTTIPLQERFFNGGENTVRSFGEDELGPKDSTGEPLGGEVFNVLSAELRQRIQGNFEGALFVDTGNLLAKARDVFSVQDFRFALGLGLRYLLPIGPVRLDAGWNPDPQPGEADGAVHFSIGMSF